MSRSISLIQSARIASPCDMKWEDMTGDDRVRHCRKCKLDVYNFREMTEADANALLANATGRVCGQLWRRKDGTVMTKDCPVGLAAVHRKIYMGFAKIAAAVIVVFSAFTYGRSRERSNYSPAQSSYQQTTERIHRWLDGPSQIAFPGKMNWTPPSRYDTGEIYVVPVDEQ